MHATIVFGTTSRHDALGVGERSTKVSVWALAKYANRASLRRERDVDVHHDERRSDVKRAVGVVCALQSVIEARDGG